MSLPVMQRGAIYVPGLPPGTSSAPSGIASSKILDDMGLPNDYQVQDVPGKAWENGPGYVPQGLLRGDANPNWFPGTAYELSGSTGYGYVAPWNVVMPGVGNAIVGARVATKGHEVFVLRASTGQWSRPDGTGSVDMTWADFYDSVVMNDFGGVPWRGDPGAEGHRSFSLPAGSNTVHGGANDFTVPDPFNVIALHVRCWFKLVPETVGGSLDIAASRWQAQVGWDPKIPNQGYMSAGYWAGGCASRCVAIGGDWTLVTATNVYTNPRGPGNTRSYIHTPYNTALKTFLTESELLVNLPPGVSGSTAPVRRLPPMQRRRIYLAVPVTPPAGPAITTASLPDGYVGDAYSGLVEADSSATVTWSLPDLAALLPPGLVLDASTGAITGTPTQVGTFYPKFRASDANGVDETSISIEIIDDRPVPPTVSTSSLLPATAGVSGGQQLTFAGTGTITATAVGLPAGASMSSAGLIAWDTTVAAGTYMVVITPTSSTAGVGTPRLYQWRVESVTTDDPGAWAPHLRVRR